MLIIRSLFISLLFIFLPLQKACAEVAVLVHGYLSDAGTWERSGVNALLRQAGWHYAGNLSFSPAGLVEQPVSAKQADKLFYTVNLPSLAPAPAQASWLKAAVDRISQENPDENITLVGHSAGGVVARLMLVQYGKGKVDRLTRIAHRSPSSGVFGRRDVAKIAR